MDKSAELLAEQAFVNRAYDRLEARIAAVSRIGEERALVTPGDLLERDKQALVRARREVDLRVGDLSLCFGRLDCETGDTWHVGRVGLDDELGDPLLIDWRAGVAEPFYRATPSDPLGVVRRRHLRCRVRTVLDLDDELLTESDGDRDLVIVGEAALLRALDRRRTGRMHDIVATIQATQDEIIRAPLHQALVVQGGPGTGKTAVALHRIAYLLFTHREELESKGVLLIGPTPTFLHYIESVLPSLGEQGAKLSVLGALRTGATPTRADTPRAAAVKGDARMVEVLRRAIDARERPLTKPFVVPFGAYRLRLGPRSTARIVEAVRAAPGSHNERRTLVEQLALERLYRLYLRGVERASLAGRRGVAVEPREFESTAAASRETRALLDRLWPVLTPERLLADLLTRPALLAAAADGLLTDDEQRAIARPAGEPLDNWSEADHALLDEVAGPLGRPRARAAERHASEDLDWMADRVLEAIADDPTISLNANMAAEIRERIVNEEVGEAPAATLRRVATTFGHVVVDEAQDVSPMQWRMIARRCPGSFTIVGDLGQASGHWRRDWQAVLDQVANDGRGRVAELAVNYRTPAEVMELAGRVLAAGAPGMQPPASVRSTGVAPCVERVTGRVAAAAATAARAFVEGGDSGTIAVVAPVSLRDELAAELESCPSTRSVGIDPLQDPVALLTATTCKGLEFDVVIVVEPAAIVDESPSGLLALYVALTRTTNTLSVLHTRALPACLRDG